MKSDDDFFNKLGYNELAYKQVYDLEHMVFPKQLSQFLSFRVGHAFIYKVFALHSKADQQELADLNLNFKNEKQTVRS